MLEILSHGRNCQRTVEKKIIKLCCKNATINQKIGIIYDLYLDRRGNRDVALANVHEITNSKNNLALLGRQKEVLVVNLEILSKVGANNELFSI